VFFFLPTLLNPPIVGLAPRHACCGWTIFLLFIHLTREQCDLLLQTLFFGGKSSLRQISFSTNNQRRLLLLCGHDSTLPSRSILPLIIIRTTDQFPKATEANCCSAVVHHTYNLCQCCSNFLLSFVSLSLSMDSPESRFHSCLTQPYTYSRYYSRRPTFVCFLALWMVDPSWRALFNEITDHHGLLRCCPPNHN
jgi:hypothetical protein